MSRLSSRLHPTPARRLVRLGCMVALLHVVVALPLQAPVPSPSKPTGPTSRLALRLAPIGFEQRFKADIEDGGDLEQRRVYGGLQLQLQSSERWHLGLNTAYTHHQFRFSGATSFGQLDPWEHINLLSFSAPVTFHASEHWQFAIIPFLQLNMESGADAGQSVTGGGLLSVVYRFGERFSLGLGVGGENRLEDGGALFLFPIVEWHITEAIRLVGNIRQPFPMYTLELQAELGTAWRASLGIDMREDRFRLDDKGTAPKGIGEVNQATLRASLTYRLQQTFLLTVYGGVGVGHVRKYRNSKRYFDASPRVAASENRRPGHCVRRHARLATGLLLGKAWNSKGAISLIAGAKWSKMGTRAS